MKIGDLFIKLGLDKKDFDKGLGQAKSDSQKFGEAIKSIRNQIVGVFAVDKILQFGKEVFNIATQAEGVRTAFSKIGTSGDLDRLRDAVKGTVSDMELMKRSVIASNFGIPIESLGKLFAFAAKRAQDTGQSIDYLVDSIVIGIGRKSPLILDNLGISIVELRKRMGGISAETATVAELTKVVGDIADEAMRKTGGLADTLGTKVQTLSASFENLKLSLSSIFSNSQMLKDDLDDWSKLIQIWQDSTITNWQKFLASFSQVQADKIFNAKKLTDDYAKMYADARSAAKTTTPPPKQDPIVLTAVEQLAAIKKVNEELEAQRILRQEFKGEKMQPISGIGAPDKLPLNFMDTNQLQLGDLGDSWKENIKKNKQFTEEYLQDWKDFTLELNDIISSGIADAISSLADGLGQLASGAMTGKDFGNQILTVIGSFMKTLGSAIIAMGVGMLALNLGLKTMNPLLLIGGGAALVAAGGLISGLAKGGVKGSASASASSGSSGYSNTSQSSALAALSGNVVFELEGNKLRGVLNNQDRKNSLIR